jgi:Tol biopolymer transport system component
MSAHGRFVTFASLASNLIPPGDTNRSFDVFVRDRSTEVTRRVTGGRHGTLANGHSYSPSISTHGRFVGFSSDASNLVTGDTNNRYDVFMRDRVAQATRRVSVGAPSAQSNDGSFEPAISAHGRFVAGDTNDTSDIFLRRLSR